MLLVIRYLLIPTCFSLLVTSYVFLTGTHNQAGVYSFLLYSILFYGAPFFLFSVLTLTVKPSIQIIHSGFIGMSMALLLVSSIWFLPPDKSGLPIQWMMYWPLSTILGFIFIMISFIFQKYKKVVDSHQA